MMLVEPHSHKERWPAFLIGLVCILMFEHNETELGSQHSIIVEMLEYLVQEVFLCRPVT